MFIIRGHFYSILFTTELRIKNFLKCSFGRERKEGGIIVETNCCLIKNTFCNIKCMQQKAGSKLFHVIVVCDINAQSHILVLFHEAIRLCYCQCYQLTFIRVFRWETNLPRFCLGVLPSNAFLEKFYNGMKSVYKFFFGFGIFSF